MKPLLLLFTIVLFYTASAQPAQVLHTQSLIREIQAKAQRVHEEEKRGPGRYQEYLVYYIDSTTGKTSLIRREYFTGHWTLEHYHFSNGRLLFLSVDCRNEHNEHTRASQHYYYHNGKPIRHDGQPLRKSKYKQYRTQANHLLHKSKPYARN